MTNSEPIESTNLDGYGHAELPWSRAHDQLAAGGGAGIVQFLGTTGPDGRPHSAPVGAMWHEGQVYFTSGPGTRKSRNLAENPFCTLSMRLKGIDVVLEGEAARVTDTDTLTALANRYSDHGWPASVDGDAITAPYSAPAAGPAPWHLYRVTIHTAIGTASTEPHGATRWRF